LVELACPSACGAMKFSSVLGLAVGVASAAGLTQGDANALETESASRQDQLDDLEIAAERLSRLSKLETNEGKTQHTFQSWCDGLAQESKAVSAILASTSPSVAQEASQEESDFKASAERACDLQDKLFEKINNQDLADLRQEVTTGQRALRGAAPPQAQHALLQRSSGADDADEDEEDGDEEEDENDDDAKTATTASKVKEASESEVASQNTASAAAGKSDSDEDEDEEDGDDQEQNVNALLQKLQGQAKAISFMQIETQSMPAVPAGSITQAKQWCSYFIQVDDKGSGWMKTIQQAQDDSTARIAAEEAAQATLRQQKEEIQARDQLAQTWKQQAKSIGDVLAQMKSSIGFLKENLATQPTQALESNILGSHEQLLNSMQEVYVLRQKHVDGQEQHLAALQKDEESAKQTLSERKKSSEKSAEHLQMVHKQVAGIMKACKQISGHSKLELMTQGMALS